MTRKVTESKRAEDKVEKVNHPKHYNTGNIEVIDYIYDQKLGFCEGNAVKYISRARHKGTEIEDLKKAQWYIERRIRELEGEHDEFALMKVR